LRVANRVPEPVPRTEANCEPCDYEVDIVLVALLFLRNELIPMILPLISAIYVVLVFREAMMLLELLVRPKTVLVLVVLASFRIPGIF
jgi:hypothetical protein